MRIIKNKLSLILRYNITMQLKNSKKTKTNILPRK